MHRPFNTPAPKRDRALAVVALTLLILLGAYQFVDMRFAFRDFSGWWTFFAPMYPGDDYVAVSATAEHQSDWHDRYRAITIGVAIHRMLDRVYYVVQPTDMWLLWGEYEDAPRSWDAPGIKDDYYRYTTSQTDHIMLGYDPVLPDSTIDRWRENGWVTDLAWQVSYVDDGTDDTTVILHTDAERRFVYLVPAHLSPVADQFGDIVP